MSPADENPVDDIDTGDDLTVVTETPESGEEPNEFAELADLPDDLEDGDDSDVEAVEEAGAAEAGQEGDDTPAEADADAASAASTAEVEPAPADAASTAQPDPAPEPEPAPEPSPEMSPEQAAQVREQWLKDSTDNLAENLFAMTDEEFEQFEENPREALPKLAAKATIHAIESATSTIMMHLPTMIQSMSVQVEAQSKATEDFFAAWPALDKSKDIDTIQRIGATYRQLYPNASKEEFITNVGAQAMMALGRAPTAAAAPGAVTSEAPAPAPHRPAGSTPRPATPPKGNPSNEFEDLAMNADLDD
jgi:hypothetical protein